MDDNGRCFITELIKILRGMRVVAVDEGGRNVRELIVNEAETPSRTPALLSIAGMILLQTVTT